MGTSDRSAFDPLDLEVIDRVYEAACAALLARNPETDANKESARQKNLRQRLFVLAQPGSVDFDTLFDQVMSTYDPPKATPDSVELGFAVVRARTCQAAISLAGHSLYLPTRVVLQSRRAGGDIRN
jgi:hypothetical protein